MIQLPWQTSKRLQAQLIARRRRQLRTAAVQEQNGICIYCRQRFTAELLPTLEHIVPLSKGGDDHPTNVVAACESCNNERGNRNYYAFLRYKHSLLDRDNWETDHDQNYHTC
jgi:5-methylcytosine-specific restriction endonuclease McrA